MARRGVCVRKLSGLLPDVSWTEVAALARFNSGAGLRRLASYGNPYSSIHDPFAGTSDRMRGRELFASDCSVSYAPLLASSNEVGKWLLPSGSYDGQRFSRDTQINVANVSRLAVQWIHQFARYQK